MIEGFLKKCKKTDFNPNMAEQTLAVGKQGLFTLDIMEQLRCSSANITNCKKIYSSELFYN